MFYLVVPETFLKAHNHKYHHEFAFPNVCFDHGLGVGRCECVLCEPVEGTNKTRILKKLDRIDS